MRPVTRDLEFTRADGRYKHQFQFRQNGQPLYWVGMTFAAHIRRGPDNADFVAFAVDESQLAFGILDVSLSQQVVETMSGAYVWDLERTDGAGDRRTIVAGNVFVRADVTHAVVP